MYCSQGRGHFENSPTVMVWCPSAKPITDLKGDIVLGSLPKTTDYDSLQHLIIYKRYIASQENNVITKLRYSDVILTSRFCTKTWVFSRFFFQYRLTILINIIDRHISRPLLPPRAGISSHIWETMDPANSAANTTWQHYEQQANAS